MNKFELRKNIKNQRKQMLDSGDIAFISSKIVSAILNWDEYNNCKNIALYYPIEGEIDLLELLKCKNKNFYFPKCIDNELVFAKYNGEYRMGAYSIPEPLGDDINPNLLDIIFTPALCCNNKCYRLGYGKGFYDKFFAKHNLNAKKVIVVPACFITDEFIEDKSDYKCDLIISDNFQ